MKELDNEKDKYVDGLMDRHRDKQRYKHRHRDSHVLSELIHELQCGLLDLELADCFCRHRAVRRTGCRNPTHPPDVTRFQRVN